MGMNAAQAAKPAGTGTQPSPVRKFDRMGVSHHDMGDGTATIQQYADLAPNFATHLGQGPGEFVGDQAVRRNASAEQTLELAGLVGLEAKGVSGDLYEALLVDATANRVPARRHHTRSPPHVTITL